MKNRCLSSDEKSVFELCTCNLRMHKLPLLEALDREM